MRRGMLWCMALSIMVVCLAGCGTMFPSTVISPPENKIVHQESAVTGGTARSRTKTIVIETPAAPLPPAQPVPPAPAPKPKEQSRADVERAWWDVALGWVLPGSPAYADPVRLPDGRNIDAQPGSKITITESESESKNDDTRNSVREGDTRAAGLATNQPQKEKFDTGSAGALDLGDTSSSPSTKKSSGGAFSAEGAAMPSSWMYLIGGLVMSGGLAIIVFLKDVKGGLITLVGGAGIAFAGYVIPTYGGWILLALGVAGAAWFFLMTKRGKEALAQLRGVTDSQEQVIDQVIVAVQKGVEALPKPTLDADGNQVGPVIDLLNAMSKSMDGGVKAFVKKYKADNGIG